MSAAVSTMGGAQSQESLQPGGTERVTTLESVEVPDVFRVDVAAVARDAVELLGATRRLHGIEVSLELPEDVVLARVSGRRLQALPDGEVDLLVALRYEPADQTLRGHRPEILDLRWPGLPPETRDALLALLPVLARETLAEVVLHQFTARELALPATMGFEPASFTVVDDGLLVVFGPRQRP